MRSHAHYIVIGAAVASQCKPTLNVELYTLRFKRFKFIELTNFKITKSVNKIMYKRACERCFRFAILQTVHLQK